MLALLDPAFWEMNASLTVQRQRKWMTLPKTGAASMAATIGPPHPARISPLSGTLDVTIHGKLLALPPSFFSSPIW
jgi:hypothetical protein